LSSREQTAFYHDVVRCKVFGHNFLRTDLLRRGVALGGLFDVQVSGLSKERFRAPFANLDSDQVQ